MSKKDSNQDIHTLFKKVFNYNDFDKEKGNEVKFNCPFMSDKYCMVNTKTEPIFSSSPGNPDTEYMVIAEAPSSDKKRIGARLGKYSYEFTPNLKSPLFELIDFVKKEFGNYPYFTDAIKCGFSNQTNKKTMKDIFKKRKKYCQEQFLVHEINIIKPKKIFCIGKTALSIVSELKKNNKIDTSIDICPLMHYGSNANLNLTIEDKKNIFWKMQSGKISKDEFIEKLPELSMVKKIIANNI